MTKLLLLPVLLTAVVLSSLACGVTEAGKGAEPTDHSVYMSQLDAQIEASKKRVAEEQTSLLERERLATLWLERGRSSGRLADYVAADAVMGLAGELGPSKPWLSRARLNYALHRLDAAEADLDVLEATPLWVGGSYVDLLLLRGDLAFHRSQYAVALAHYEDAYARRRTFGAAFRLALYHANTGDLATALPYVEQARLGLGDSDTRNDAWLTFQVGVMHLEQNQVDQALGYFEDADRLFSGWYLIEEHIAEVKALQGRLEEAERLYRDIVKRTELPEFMDALADVLEQRGKVGEIAALRERARNAFDAQLKVLPSAASGHALDHYLAHGPPARALALAHENHGRRPNATAKLQLAMAYAQLANVRAADLLREVLLSPYRTRAVADACVEVMSRLELPQDERVSIQCRQLSL